MYRRDLRDTSHDDLLGDAAAADAAIQAVPGPDGRVASVIAREGQPDLWVHEDGDHRRLTSAGILAQRFGRGDPQWVDWHDSGDEIAYLTAEAEAAVVDVETGEKRTVLEEALAVAWDADELVVTTDRFSRASLARVAADGSRVEAIADDDYLYSAPAPGEDGVYAVRSRHRDLFDYAAELVRVEDGVDVLYAEEGVRAMDPAPGPDGELAFVHDASGYDEVALLTDDGPETVYAVDGAEVAEPAWNADGSKLAVTVTRDAAAEVHVVDTETGEGEVVADGKRFHTAPAFHGNDVLATVDSAQFPGEVRNLTGGERVTPATFAGLEERLVEPETMTYRSAGEEIQAVVYPPGEDADPDSVPLLVKAHGGPTSFDRYRFDWRAGYFAALGYAVICPNYRGSDGYGRAFRMENDYAWGAGDLDDVVNAADALAEAYDAVDGDRAGIFGGSGGGLMTANALGTTDRFDAGAAFYGVYDYESFVNDTDDIGWQLMKRELGDLSTDLENYRDASPIRHVPDIEAPLLVLHGEEDVRVPVSQSEQLVEELEKHGKRHEFQRYEGEPHGFGKRENVLDAYTRVADLFAKYLRVDPDDGSSEPHHGEGD